MNTKRIIRSLVIIIAALGFSALVAWIQVRSYGPTPGTSRPAQGVAGQSVGGPFTLRDHRGNTFTAENLRGRHALIYFGFTFCPAICPTELQKMTVAMKQAGPAADVIQPVFITVDPERDTQDVMAAYVSQFNDRLIGLTGSREQIDAALKAYRIYARKVADPAMSDYTMDHSSYIYFIDPNGMLLGIYGVSSTPAEIATAIKAAIPAP